jgi:tRNA threonylcarbamoyladenosine biosynthesis protein TsaB
MIVIGLRTDKPLAELYLYDGEKKLATVKWQAHLKLAETLNINIEKILNKSSITYVDLEAIAVFKGPGSFTGLRIGLSVANALAYALDIPIVAKGGDNWLPAAVQSLQNGQNDQFAIPKYGAPARTTQPRK